MEPTKEPWADHAQRPKVQASSARARLPMEPTKAPWALDGLPADAIPARPAGPSAERPMAAPEGRAYTGAPVAEVVTTSAHMPAPAPGHGGAGEQRAFVRPQKCIHNKADLDRFLQSQTVREFVGFIRAMDEAVRGVKVSDECRVSAPVEGLLHALRQLSAWVDEIPPARQAMRYGNPAYRTWFARMTESAEELLLGVLPPDLAPAAVELVPYFTDSFGNATRIDYGTGHETTFCALLCCLAKLGVLTGPDLQALVTRVFVEYIHLMRKVQTTYWLEPAGSHGVWGLDDYQFLPFLWGASQLVGHPYIRPGSIHSQEVLDTSADDYLYLSCVRFVKQVKKGPLAETSPMLNDISAVPSWAKVNSGMLKMYQVEVLSKVPIMQHFLFGSLLPFC